MRIISLLPSATEILFAVGAGDDVVAVTHECDYPAAASTIPSITRNALPNQGLPAADIDRHVRRAVHEGSSIYRLDEDLLRNLRPDLIVTQELCDVCAVSYRDVSAAVRRLGTQIPVLSLEPSTVTDILSTIVEVGRATGRLAQATRVVDGLRERVESVHSRAARDLGETGSRPRVVCIEWTDPLMAGGHWVPEMVEIAGGIDVLGVAAQPSCWVEWDAIVAARPDVMVLMPCGFGLEQTMALGEDIVRRATDAGLPCALSGRIAAVDGSSYFNRPGPRIADGLEIIAAVLSQRPGTALPTGAAWMAGEASSS